MQLLFEGIANMRKYYPMISDEDFNAIIAADPTSNVERDISGKYSKWLLNLYKQKKLKLEDLYKATEYLTNFDNNKRYLSIKDINQIKSLPDLFDLLDNAEIPELSDRQKLRQTQKAVRQSDITNDADIAYRGNRWTVYVPKTYEASCKLGQGTQWCTATTASDNYYRQYTSQGPLYILINNYDPEEKYQFHFESSQFMDSSDRRIDLEDFLDKEPEIKEFYADVEAKAFAEATVIIDNDAFIVWDSSTAKPITFAGLDASDFCSKAEHYYIIHNKESNDWFAFDTGWFMLKESVESYYGGRMSGDATFNGLFETIPSIKQYISKIISEQLFKSPDGNISIELSKDHMEVALDKFCDRTKFSEDFVYGCLDGDLYQYYMDNDYYSGFDSKALPVLDTAVKELLSKNNLTEEDIEYMIDNSDELDKYKGFDVSEIRQAAYIALSEGQIVGTIDEVCEDFWNAVREATGCNADYDGDTVLFTGNTQAVIEAFYEYNDEYYNEYTEYAIDMFVAAISMMKFDEPYYGWDGFSDSAFNNRFYDELVESVVGIHE